MHISLAAETIFHIFGLPITNSILSTWLIIGFLLIISLLLKMNLKLLPSGLQHIVEALVEWLYATTRSVLGNEKLANSIFPLLLTFFIFILTANWFGLLPGLSAIGLTEIVRGEEVLVPLFRAPTSDLNTTLALTAVSIIVTHALGLKALGFFGYLKKLFYWKTPIDALSGILELISEFSKVFSFSFRLFGNIFAGEVLIAVMTSLVPLILPMPFIAFEIFVGFIQAFVFTILTLVFISLAVTSHHQPKPELKAA